MAGRLRAGSVWWGLLRLALAAAILVYSAEQLAEAWRTVDLSAMSLRLAPLCLGAVFGGAALVTLALVSAAGARAAGLGASGARFYLGWTRVWFQSYFFRYVPGKVALVIERARLGERLSVPRSASVVLVLWESLLLVAGAALLGGVGVLLLPAERISGGSPVSGLAILALAALGLLASIALGPLLRTLSRRSPWLAHRLPDLVLEVSPWSQGLLVLGNTVAWALLGLSFAETARALPSPGLGEAPDMVTLVTWFVASYVGGQVTSVAPAGLGVREAILVAGLSSGMPAPVVLAWAVAHRVISALVEIVLVASTLLIPLPDATATASTLE